MIGTFFLYALALACAIPALTLACECFLSLLPLRNSGERPGARRPRIAVLVPAHDEETGIVATIEAINSQLLVDDRLIVIADNCTDDTARIACQAGATVWERVDHDRRGKGYAIRFALSRLVDDPPEVVVCIDADCLPAAGCIDRIASESYVSQRPIQAAYVMHACAHAPAFARISAFAVLVKNYIRPRGLQNAGLPCLITGSGVAYPWSTLEFTPHPDSHIVEDMRYSVDLALAGRATRPCVAALVHSDLPGSPDAAISQRRRWEHGHIGLILSESPRLIRGFLRNGSLNVLVLLLELIVPPLSLLVPTFLAGGVVLAGGAWLTGAWGPFSLWCVAVVFTITGLSLAWWTFGRRELPPQVLMSIPAYVAAKLPIYRAFLRSREKIWVRTERTSSSTSAIGMPTPHFSLDQTRDVDVRSVGLDPAGKL